MLRDRAGDPVLVLLAPAQEADIGVVNPQEEFRTSVRLGLALYHPAANERSFRSRLDNISQHDRVRPPRGIGAVGNSRLRNPQRQPPIPRGRAFVCPMSSARQNPSCDSGLRRRSSAARWTARCHIAACRARTLHWRWTPQALERLTARVRDIAQTAARTAYGQRTGHTSVAGSAAGRHQRRRGAAGDGP